MNNTSMRKVVTLRSDDTDAAVQGVPQYVGITGNSAGATGIAMNLTAFGPGGKAKVHYHRDFETAIYGITGRIGLYHGPQLEDYCLVEPGTFCFIPPGVPHIAFNLSESEPATAISSRNDAAEQENVALVPELEGLRDSDIGEIKRRAI